MTWIIIKQCSLSLTHTRWSGGRRWWRRWGEMKRSKQCEEEEDWGYKGVLATAGLMRLFLWIVNELARTKTAPPAEINKYHFSKKYGEFNLVYCFIHFSLGNADGAAEFTPANHRAKYPHFLFPLRLLFSSCPHRVHLLFKSCQFPFINSSLQLRQES